VKSYEANIMSEQELTNLLTKTLRGEQSNFKILQSINDILINKKEELLKIFDDKQLKLLSIALHEQTDQLDTQISQLRYIYLKYRKQI
jgi:hypothetical protein